MPEFKEQQVVILCGGQGTRLREETEFKPKAMVQVGGRPILWHLMRTYYHWGFRRFVLTPAAEVAPQMIHPPTGQSIEQLLNHLNTSANYAAIIGLPGAGKTLLARELAARCQATMLIDSPPAASRSTWPPGRLRSL